MIKKTTKPASEAKDESLFMATLSVIEDLSAVLSEEIVLVQKQDVNAIQELMRRKTKLTISYQANLKSITQPDVMKQATAEMRAKLRKAGEKLAKVSERNSLLLKAAVQATQILISNVIKVVKEEALQHQGYSDPRNLNANLGSYSPTCKPVSVSRTA